MDRASADFCRAMSAMYNVDAEADGMRLVCNAIKVWHDSADVELSHGPLLFNYNHFDKLIDNHNSQWHPTDAWTLAQNVVYWRLFGWGVYDTSIPDTVWDAGLCVPVSRDEMAAYVREQCASVDYEQTMEDPTDWVLRNFPRPVVDAAWLGVPESDMWAYREVVEQIYKERGGE